MQKHAQLNTYLESGLTTIFQAENQIHKGLQVMFKESFSPQLKEAFKRHQEETQEQIERLKKIAHMLNIDFEKSPTDEKGGILEKGKEVAKNLLMMHTHTENKVMEGLISKGKQALGYLADKQEGSDLAIAVGAQLIEEFEVISYRVLCVLARKSGHEEIAQLMEQTLKEEQKAWETMKTYFDENVDKIEI